MAIQLTAPRGNDSLAAWVSQAVSLCEPDDVHWCDGSDEEFDRLCELLVESGTLERLSEERRPNSYLARSHPGDVARVEDRTFICSRSPRDAGPTNNWRDPDAMRTLLRERFRGVMRGRTAYVVPFSMGPLGSPAARLGVQFTDSAYAAASMRLMTRMGAPALEQLEFGGGFVPCMHTVGAPGDASPWPCDEEKYIAHFPETREIWSYGSGYGGNALLGKKCLALRIASVMARDEGWLAEHMLILKLTSPEGRVKHIAAAFPSACGKTNLAMLVPTLPGWRMETIGDDIAWMRFGDDGRLRAINPEAGLFGVAPGTGTETNPNAMAAISANAIFTNCARADDGDVWWEGMTPDPPARAIDWRGAPWTPDSGRPAAHPNARFTVAAAQVPTMAPECEDPAGVPIDAIVFGGRRSSVVPLVQEADDWEHGVFLGSIMGSETTAAAEGARGRLRRDPFAMLPFCGYDMGDYFRHWLAIGRTADGALPRIFGVNWFRKSDDGRWLWPGFGENVRVLEWIHRRCDGAVAARDMPIGLLPALGDVNVDGLSVDPGDLDELLHVDVDAWLSEITPIREFYAALGHSLPVELQAQLDALEQRLLRARR
jgi:phosphoenolpyruvate carboxykinase (GTP)